MRARRHSWHRSDTEQPATVRVVAPERCRRAGHACFCAAANLCVAEVIGARRGMQQQSGADGVGRALMTAQRRAQTSIDGESGPH
jgi:hypothetical protein